MINNHLEKTSQQTAQSIVAHLEIATCSGYLDTIIIELRIHSYIAASKIWNEVVFPMNIESNSDFINAFCVSCLGEYLLKQWKFWGVHICVQKHKKHEQIWNVPNT